MKSKKSIDSMNYEELQTKKEKVLFERFLGIILLLAFFLGGLILMMIRDISILDLEYLEEYITWTVSAYGLIALGSLGIIQIFVSTVDYHRVISNLKSRMDRDAGEKY